MKTYNIIFAGTPNFSCPTLQTLIEDERFHVELVITQQDKPQGRKQILTEPPVKTLAKKYDIEVVQPSVLKDIENKIKDIDPDFFIVIAYGKIIPENMLHIAKWNINLHASILPKYRGASPIQACLLKGDKETGVSIMNIEKTMDTGAVYKTHTLTIKNTDTAESLLNELSYIGKKLPEDLIEIYNGLKPIPQNNEMASYCKKITKADAEIFPIKESSEEILNKLRAFTPWPGIFFIYKEKRVKILSGNIPTYETPPVQNNPISSFGIKISNGFFLPDRILVEGKKENSFHNWIQNEKTN
jgi:methionyl-tRNA formyltransferase